MNFGLLCVGESRQVIIDGEHPVWHAIYQGSYVASPITSTGGSARVVYPSIVTTVTPPFIFISPDGPAQNMNFSHVGSPGLWTGFTMTVNNEPSIMVGYSPSGRYVACVERPPRTVGFGAQIFDGDQSVIFDSNYKIMSFVDGRQDWIYNSSIPLDVHFIARLYTSPTAFSSGDYFLISHVQGNDANYLLLGSSIGFNNFSRNLLVCSAITSANAGIPTITRPMLIGRMT